MISFRLLSLARVFLAASLLVMSLVVPRCIMAAANDWAEGVGVQDGASRDYYNRAALLPWENFLGDWRDRDNKSQGDAAFAIAAVKDTDTARFVEWDVRELVQLWHAGKHQNLGLLLRTVQQHGKIHFDSRESDDNEQRPLLKVTTTAGETKFYATADTTLDKSTYQSQGRRPELRVSGDTVRALIRFDTTSLRPGGSIKSAKLRLWTTRQYGSANVGVFRCQQGESVEDTQPTAGIADKYRFDREIEKHPDVMFAADFESDDWPKAWTNAAVTPLSETVDFDRNLNFQKLQGKALRVKIGKGSTKALGMTFKFGQVAGAHAVGEPEEVYMRYYIRLADDWNQTVQSGKLPGISGTYGVAGWGGRKSNGSNGWSARGLFRQTIPKDNPLGGKTPIGTYCYHADMKSSYGDGWVWSRGYYGYLENDRWYCVEQFLRNNTPDKKDGIIRAWIDGRLAFEKTDIRFRTIEKLRIEQVWMNVYHGGTIPSPYDQHLFIDNVVIAKSYIGPIRTR